MTIVVQIPCLNEEANIGRTIADVRDATAHLSDVRILVIDDGSTDKTVEAAFEAGADHVAKHGVNRGLARAYMTGLACALNLGADVIVNTDADNQYKAVGIPKLIEPILDGTADIVVGARPIDDIEHFSPVKKRLQRLGTAVLRTLSRTTVRDATSGFRAINREAALRLNTLSDYTYTLETLIQAGAARLRVTSVDIECNPPTRESRLMRNMRSYIWRSSIDMLRLWSTYAPLRAYLVAAAFPLALSFLLGLRYIYSVSFLDPTRSHTPSLILLAILGLLGCLIVALGMIGEMLAVNRKILEELRVIERRRALENGSVTARVGYELLDSQDGKDKAVKKRSGKTIAAS